jgi:hypothetical protein
MAGSEGPRGPAGDYPERRYAPDYATAGELAPAIALGAGAVVAALAFLWCRSGSDKP